MPQRPPRQRLSSNALVATELSISIGYSITHVQPTVQAVAGEREKPRRVGVEPKGPRSPSVTKATPAL
jgi:hypothetical protein